MATMLQLNADYVPQHPDRAGPHRPPREAQGPHLQHLPHREQGLEAVGGGGQTGRARGGVLPDDHSRWRPQDLQDQARKAQGRPLPVIASAFIELAIESRSAIESKVSVGWLDQTLQLLQVVGALHLREVSSPADVLVVADRHHLFEQPPPCHCHCVLLFTGTHDLHGKSWTVGGQGEGIYGEEVGKQPPIALLPLPLIPFFSIVSLEFHDPVMGGLLFVVDLGRVFGWLRIPPVRAGDEAEAGLITLAFERPEVGLEADGKRFLNVLEGGLLQRDCGDAISLEPIQVFWNFHSGPACLLRGPMRGRIDGGDFGALFKGKFLLGPIAGELLEGIEGGPVAKSPRIDLLSFVVLPHVLYDS